MSKLHKQKSPLRCSPLARPLLQGCFCRGLLFETIMQERFYVKHDKSKINKA